MAGSVADMLVGSALQSADKAPDISGAIESGAGLAMKIQQMKQSQQALEQKKQDQELAKFEKVGSWFDMYSKMPEGPAKKSFGDNFIKNGINALGVGDKFHPLNQEMILKDSKLAGAITDGIRRGKYDRAILGDPEKLAAAYPELIKDADANAVAALAGDYRDTFDKAAEDNYKESQSNYRNHETAQAAMNKQIQEQTAAPLVDEAKKVRADHLKFGESGQAKAEADLAKLRKSVAYFKEQSEKKSGSTGTFATAAASRVGLLGLKDPKLKVAIDDARAVINLKDGLDSQFARAEAEQQYSMRGPDPDLPPKENYTRAKEQLAAGEAAYKGKIAQFKRFGLIKDAPKKSFKDLSPSAQNEIIQHQMRQTGKSEDEVRKILGAK